MFPTGKGDENRLKDLHRDATGRFRQNLGIGAPLGTHLRIAICNSELAPKPTNPHNTYRFHLKEASYVHKSAQ